MIAHYSGVSIDTLIPNPKTQKTRYDPFDVCVPTYSEGYDVYFTQFTEQGGTYDPYPDLMIGRCSVDYTCQEKKNCIKHCTQKIITNFELCLIKNDTI
jgi:hypothetical protein